MQRQQRVRALWIALVGAVILSAVIVPLWVTADSDQVNFTAALYSDVIRFEADGVASLRVTVYDLSENELWSTGLVMGDFADWDRANARGERLANGLYLYLAQGWDSSDTLILNKAGKVVLLPGDQVELKAAPVVSSPGRGDGTPPLGPLVYETTGTIRATDSGTGRYIQLLPGPANQQITSSAGNINLTPASGMVRMTMAGKNFRFQLDDSSQAPQVLLTASGSSYLKGGNVGIGTVSPGVPLETIGVIRATDSGTGRYIQLLPGPANQQITSSAGNINLTPASGMVRMTMAGKNFRFQLDDSSQAPQVLLTASGTSYLKGGNVGIGTANATDKLTIEGSSGNLIACYPGSSRTVGAAVFRVESDGDVYADGIAYAANFITGGSADVAERINVSEWVEAGDVVEIDPDHAGFFRKATGLYSRRVAGIISTSPGVILGNDIDPATDRWDDSRPVLAIAGRVPVKVSTENGPIAVGDLLVSSSAPGVAMKGDPAVSIGAVVGKAMEPLQEGEGTIMAQVTLR